jgi:hypothetical protein
MIRQGLKSCQFKKVRPKILPTTLLPFRSLPLPELGGNLQNRRCRHTLYHHLSGIVILVLEIHRQRVVVYSFLLTFLFSGIGVASGIPIIYTALAHSHPVFFSSVNNRIRITLHHPGNHDTHEADTIERHQHDLIDAMIGLSKEDNFSHDDHELEISSSEDTFPPSPKKQFFPNVQTFFTADPTFSVFSREKQACFSGLSPPISKQSMCSLRMTLLII